MNSKYVETLTSALTGAVPPFVNNVTPLAPTQYTGKAVYIPTSWLPTSVASSSVVTVPGHSSLVVVNFNTLPSSVPTSVVQPVPLVVSTITPIPTQF